MYLSTSTNIKYPISALVKICKCSTNVTISTTTVCVHLIERFKLQWRWVKLRVLTKKKRMKLGISAHHQTAVN